MKKIKKVLGLAVLAILPLCVNAQDCAMKASSFKHGGKTAQESKSPKWLRSTSLEKYSIKAAKVGDQMAVVIGINIIPKFFVSDEDLLIFTLEGGRKVGTKPIAKAASKKTSSGREIAKVYYPISSENYKFLSKMKVTNVKVNMGHRNADIDLKGASQDYVKKLVSCLK